MVPVSFRMASGRLSRIALVSAFGFCTSFALAGDAAQVVARAGNATITVGDVERRLAAMSAPELAALGGAPAEAPRRLVEQVLVPELLAELGSAERGFDKSPRVQDRRREVLRQALDNALKREAVTEKPITKAEIQTYFEENKARFEQPQRIRIWRILVDDENAAKKLIDEVKAAKQPSKWSDLARQHSIDKATNQRQGDLGFVHPDGKTDAPRVRVDAALFRAAQAVKDGDVVPKPVAEAGKYAVVWRRGSLAAKTRTLEQEEASIRQLLERRRVDETRQGLLQKLRAEHVKGEHPEHLTLIPEGLIGDGRARQRPARARGDAGVRMPPTVRSVETPRPTDRGER